MPLPTLNERHRGEGKSMRVLAMASQKGGSGKTTCPVILRCRRSWREAGPVCLIDIDPQGSLADWWNEREAEMPAFAQTTVARLASDLEVLRQQGFRLAVIDTPPAITMAIQSVIAVAELIVIRLARVRTTFVPLARPSIFATAPESRSSSSSTPRLPRPRSPTRRPSPCRSTAPWLRSPFTTAPISQPR